jgi:hypothetical protein
MIGGAGDTIAELKGQVEELERLVVALADCLRDHLTSMPYAEYQRNRHSDIALEILRSRFPNWKKSVERLREAQSG